MDKFLKPREGFIVRFPPPLHYAILPEEGAHVDWNGSSGRYWRRRVSCGDAIVSIEKKKDPVVTKTTKDKKHGEKK